MTTVVITGAASGMGAALRRRLERNGTTVIGVDLPGTAEERASITRPWSIGSVQAAPPARLGIEACPGILCEMELEACLPSLGSGWGLGTSVPSVPGGTDA